MSGWRHQLPVYSPVSPVAVLAGLRAVISDGHPRRAERPVLELLRDRYQPKATLLTESGTAALTGALSGALGDRRGVAVAIPAFSCYDLATAAEGAGASVVLYDTDPHSLAPDLASVRAALGRGATVVVVAHLYGCPVDLVEVNRLAADAGAIVIEDAAQAAGRLRGALRKPRRGWPELVAITAQLILERPTLYALPAALPFLRLGQTIYREPRALRAPSALSYPVIAATWALAEREVAVRRRNAARLLVELGRHPGFDTIRTPLHTQPGYLRLPVLASPGVRRAAADAMAKRLGVAPGYPKALCDLEPLSARCLNRDAGFPGSRLLAARLCTLPTHSRLAAQDLTRLEHWIRAVGAL